MVLNGFEPKVEDGYPSDKPIYGDFFNWGVPWIIQFNGIFHYKPHFIPFWGIPILGNLHISAEFRTRSCCPETGSFRVPCWPLRCQPSSCWIIKNATGCSTSLELWATSQWSLKWWSNQQTGAWLRIRVINNLEPATSNWVINNDKCLMLLVKLSAGQIHVSSSEVHVWTKWLSTKPQVWEVWPQQVFQLRKKTQSVSLLSLVRNDSWGEHNQHSRAVNLAAQSGVGEVLRAVKFPHVPRFSGSKLDQTLSLAADWCEKVCDWPGSLAPPRGIASVKITKFREVRDVFIRDIFLLLYTFEFLQKEGCGSPTSGKIGWNFVWQVKGLFFFAIWRTHQLAPRKGEKKSNVGCLDYINI